MNDKIPDSNWCGTKRPEPIFPRRKRAHLGPLCGFGSQLEEDPYALPGHMIVLNTPPRFYWMYNEDGVPNSDLRSGAAQQSLNAAARKKPATVRATVKRLLRMP